MYAAGFPPPPSPGLWPIKQWCVPLAFHCPERRASFTVSVGICQEGSLESFLSRQNADSLGSFPNLVEPLEGAVTLSGAPRCRIAGSDGLQEPRADFSHLINQGTEWKRAKLSLRLWSQSGLPRSSGFYMQHTYPASRPWRGPTGYLDMAHV